MSRPSKGSGKRRGSGTVARVAGLLVVIAALVFVWWARRPAETVRVADPEEAASWPIPAVEGLSPPIQEMVDEARERLEQSPGYGGNWGHLGSVYRAHSLLEPALECYERAESLSPDDYRWPYLRAQTLGDIGGRPDEALAAYERAERLDPRQSAVLFFHAVELQLQARFDEALAKIERVLEQKPDMAAAHRVHGQLLLQLDRPEEAVRALQRATALEPGDKASWAFLSQAYQAVGRTEDAGDAAERSEQAERTIGRVADPAGAAVQFLRRDPTGTSQKARALQEKGDYAAAAQQWEYFLQTNPENHAAWIALADCQAKMGDISMAEALLERVEQMAPQEVAIPKRRAYLARVSGDPAGVVRHARRALELSPEDMEAEALLAYGLGALGRHREALLVLQEASARSELSPASHFDWANSLLQTGEPAAAAEQLRLALQKGGDNALLYRALADALEAAGDADGAAEARRKAAALPSGTGR